MEGHLSINEIADTFSVSRSTVYRSILPWIKAHCTRPIIRVGKYQRIRVSNVVAYREHLEREMQKEL